MKIGRNDPCPCGSGLKYKKCCIPKYDQPVAQASPPDKRAASGGNDVEPVWTPERLQAMSETDILNKLGEMGVRTNPRQFAATAKGHIDIDVIVDDWLTRFIPTDDIDDSDFLILAAEELWNRWLPDRFSVHKLENMMVDYLDNDRGQRVLERYWNLWTTLRDQYLLRFNVRSFEQFEQKVGFPYSMSDIFFDTAIEMIEECREREEDDPACWGRLIRLYRDMLEHLPGMEANDRLMLRHLLAQAYANEDDKEAAESIYKQLVEERPDWAWGYIGWGDLYNVNTDDFVKFDTPEALRLYRLGLERVSDESGIAILRDRIREWNEIYPSNF